MNDSLKSPIVEWGEHFARTQPCGWRWLASWIFRKKIPSYSNKSEWEPVYDATTVRYMIEGAWCAGYYNAGYTHDSAYAEKQSEACADQFLKATP